MMVLEVYNGRRIDASAVHHDAEVAINLAVAFANDGNGLSCLDVRTDVNEVLGIVAIDGLQSVAVADDDGIAKVWSLS